MTATIRTNSDETLVEIETPEGIVFGPLPMPEGDDGEPAEPIFCVDDEDPDAAAYIVTVSAYEGLKPNTMYKLVPVETVIETKAELTEEDDEEEEDEEGGILVGQ